MLPSQPEVGTTLLRNLPAFSARAGPIVAVQLGESDERPKSAVRLDGTRLACCACLSWRSFM